MSQDSQQLISSLDQIAPGQALIVSVTGPYNPGAYLFLTREASGWSETTVEEGLDASRIQRPSSWRSNGFVETRGIETVAQKDNGFGGFRDFGMGNMGSDVALVTLEASGPDQVLLRPGMRVACLSDETQEGVVIGPSEYEGGVMVRFSNTLTYPCSNTGLKVLSAPEGTDFAEEERDDFEAWLFVQSNVMHSMDLIYQREAYRKDADWHTRRPGKRYKSRA